MIKTLLNKLESKILTKLFLRWVDNEYDLELLSITKGMIQKKEAKIKSMIDLANKVEIKGYRKNYA